ncbi:MOSC domain-containing protein [Actinoplanes sp. NPDC023801]|uniref:MOSC domain-containing protein n=1 Tax=Actinoplanes sp. NPDC023801 TaxID=3154595 RepID=UPI003408FCEC
MSDESGTVAAVSRNEAYTFTKPNRDEIVLVAGLGVDGDVHAGVTVRHRSRVAADPHQPNLRQVHLIHGELFEEVAGRGYQVPAGGLGENVTTRGIDLLGLPRGTILRFGPPATSSPEPAGGAGSDGSTGADSPVRAVLAAAGSATLDEATARAAAAVAAAVERDAADGVQDPRPAVIVAGLRNPCAQINGFRDGLLKEVLGRAEDGSVVRKAGVMGVVLRGGRIRPGDPIAVELPPGEHGPLERV